MSHQISPESLILGRVQNVCKMCAKCVQNVCEMCAKCVRFSGVGQHVCKMCAILGGWANGGGQAERGRGGGWGGGRAETEERTLPDPLGPSTAEWAKQGLPGIGLA